MANPIGSAPSIILATGLGAAAATALEPVMESARQTAWGNNKVRVLTPELNAALVAQGAISLDGGRIQAHLEGYDDDKFDGLVQLALKAPPLPLVLELWRRGRFGTPDPANPPAQVLHALAKEQLEAQYWNPVTDLFNERLSAQAVALGIIRSLLKDPGFFPVQLNTSGGVVPSYPVSNIDPIAEAQAMGFDAERLRVMVGSIGRPPGPGELARATFRNIIQLPDFNRGVLEGDTRPEWAQTFLDVNREILTAGQYAELELRGFLTPAQRVAETDKHGMSQADSDLLYNLLGRSIPEHQITTGLARGGVFEGPINTIPKAYLQSLQRGNLRPEYYNLAYANRYSYPSGFQVKGETTAGDLPEAEAEQLLLEMGWDPKWAKFFATAWAKKATGVALNPVVKAQQTKLLTAMHKAAVKTGVPRSALEVYLEPIVPVLADRDAIFQLWADERAVDQLAGG